VLAVTPEYEGVKIKLYTAHLNYGYLLVGEEKYPEAEQQFNQALEIMPNSSAALAGLKMLKEQEESGDIVYLVRWGDSLTIIARRFKTTIQAIKEANGLTSDRIYAGRELRIPQ
jgi:tetratricopeptide (TPR) repeat protein